MFKKVSILALAILFIAGVAFAATPGYRQDVGAGDILSSGYQSTPGKIFRMVRYVPTTYSGATTLIADSIVIWNLTEDDGVTITTSTTSYDSAVAGIIVARALTPDTDGNTAAQDRGGVNWTWLQTYGLSEVRVDGDCCVSSAGEAMGCSTTAGEAAPFVSSTSDARLQGNAGFFFDAASAGDDDVECFISLD